MAAFVYPVCENNNGRLLIFSYFLFIFSESDLRNNSYKSSESAKSDSIVFAQSVEITDDVSWFLGNYSQSSSDHSEDDTENDANCHHDNEEISFSNFVGILSLNSVAW